MYLLPKPKEVIWGNERICITSRQRIVLGCTELGIHDGWALPDMLQKEWKMWSGIRVEIVSGSPRNGDIFLNLSKDLGEQEYELRIFSDGIHITGKDRAAVGYGIATLCQIIRQYGTILPHVWIKDAPDIAVRGYYMDQARGRSLKLDALKTQVDALCRYKCNHYEIYIEQSFAFEGMSEMWREDSVITPYEIMELDRYCKNREMDLVPSIASFGHLYELLRTNSFEELCELEHSYGKEFSFWDKMQHHTVDVTNEQSFSTITKMLDEFLPCFSSKYVNICADETFDLGRGKSKEMAKRLGKDRLYLNFLKRLCEYVVAKGKIPMFWGDIISKDAALLTELPKETICMTWGYAPNQSDTECLVVANAGANQYICPGVCGWNRLINLYEDAYHNIKTMAGYANTYHALGFVNTDWGDFGHINDPEYSIPAMIYGAAFAWNTKGVDDMEEMNRMIARLEYADSSENVMDIFRQLSKQQRFHWWLMVLLFEGMLKKQRNEDDGKDLTRRECKRIFMELARNPKSLDMANQTLETCEMALFENARHMDSSQRGIIHKMQHTIRGIAIMNHIAKALIHAVFPMEAEQALVKQNFVLAAELEEWYMQYKEIFRESSKESMLPRVSTIIFGYADLLREGKIGSLCDGLEDVV